MAPIKSILAVVTTGDRTFAETDGEVFLGICGREFNLDTAANDFQQADLDKGFILGEGSNVLFPELNDPRSPQLDTNDLSAFPKYIRFEPGAELAGKGWNLERVTVTVNPGSFVFDNLALKGTPNIWLGQNCGKFFYLK